MRAYENAGQKFRDELKRIETLQREWNALSVAERASVAKVSPDLSLFFRPRVGREDRDGEPGATGKVIDLMQAVRRRIGDAHAKPKDASCGPDDVQRGEVNRDPARSQKKQRL